MIIAKTMAGSTCMGSGRLRHSYEMLHNRSTSVVHELHFIVKQSVFYELVHFTVRGREIDPTSVLFNETQVSCQWINEI